MKRRILLIVGDIRRAQEHEWYVDYLDKSLFEPEFALINSRGSAMEAFLHERNIRVWHFSYRGKTDLPWLTWNLWRRMIKGKYHVVHTHLFEPSLAGLTASVLAGVKKRVMTRHYSDYHHVWFKPAVKYDRYLNILATDIIAISRNVQRILIEMEQVKPEKVHLVHHGLEIADYDTGAVSDERVSAIRKRYHLQHLGPVIGTISRFTELKGLQFLIPAFKKLLNRYPGAVLFMANATGDYQSVINSMLSDIPDKNIRKVLFEEDIAALYRVFDCFVHIPVNETAEAFGQTYLEALASRVPSVFTISGVAPEFVIDGENCFIVPHGDERAVLEKLEFILANPRELEQITRAGYEVVKEKFTMKAKIKKLEKIYTA